MLMRMFATVVFISAMAVGCGGGADEPPPNPDRDGDGIANEADACPNTPETFNDYQDEDGCADSKPPPPPVDTDGDGIVDGSDQCPSQRETQNGYLDSDGCPDDPTADSDGDGVTDGTDACPTQDETPNGYQDGDGCPDTAPPADSDGDGISDPSDSCPSDAETVNGHRDTDGCPDVHASYTGRWTGTVTMQLQNESPIRYTGTLNGAANGFQAILGPVCPLGDGTMSTTTYTNQYEVSWSGSLSCAPVAFNGGCQSVVFTFTGAAFALTQGTGNIGAAGGGTATGCGISKPFTMTFSGVRQ
jgi:hypothetical protein